MPWRITSVPDQRRLFMERLIQDDLTSLSALCREFGISRTTAYKWQARYDPHQADSLVDRSRAPYAHPNATPPAQEERILGVRQAHPTWGPRKIRAFLQRSQAGTPWPSDSTIGQILKTNGCILPRRHKRAHPEGPHTPLLSGAPNAVWTLDFKGQFQTRDGQWCYPLTLLDHHSRYLLRLQTFPGIDTVPVQTLMQRAFEEFGLPERIRSDNGPPFGSRAVGRLSRLSVWWVRLGIVPSPSRPGTPGDNGAHERFHRTLLADAVTPPAATRRRQQEAFCAYRTVYNEERPHEALALHTPAQVYTPSPRTLPRVLPEMVYPDAALPRYVHPNGCLRFGGRELFLSEALSRQTVGFFPVAQDRFVVCFGPVPLAIFDERKGDWLSRAKAQPVLTAFARPTEGGGAGSARGLGRADLACNMAEPPGPPVRIR